MARQFASGMGSHFKECGCSRPTRCLHPYTIRFRDALGKQREEAGYGTQDDAIERLTQISAEKKKTALSVAEVRRELGQQAVAEWAKQWRPRQRRMTEYSTGWHVDSSINVHIIAHLASRKVNAVTPIVVIPSLSYVKKVLTVADEDLALEIVMMAGCGWRKGEARAVNINSVVADDVCRVHKQIHSTSTSRQS
ncbi:hypothetical protein ACFOZ0_30085 [Streptomyces yaanensis]|uniref:Integrase n=1 Tax=Streptomyces yaanensis TaxID=1142239 RepID=A0ABV7SM95_9ACTN|nr:hypothetical protein [Streptomyces sp. CGMCC 4.7035]WNC00417.1 hypothetical protein Q2K21_21440 [Streptomyces sp. CGMCC 4.7035]